MGKSRSRPLAFRSPLRCRCLESYTNTNECMSIISFLSTHNTIPKSFSSIWMPCITVYILNRSLAEGNVIPRWQPRSHFGIFLGRSPSHAKDVSLVLDLKTNHISAKYHIIFDDTIQPSDKNNEIWSKLFIKQLQSTLNDNSSSHLLKNLFNRKSYKIYLPTNQQKLLIQRIM